MTRASRVACTSESPLSSVQKTSVSRTVKLSGTCHSVMSVVAVRGEWIINQPCLSSASADRDGQYHTQQMSLVQMDRSPPDCISQHFSQHLRGKTFWEIRSLCNITPETNAIHQHLPSWLTDGDSQLWTLINCPNISNLNICYFYCWLLSLSWVNISSPVSNIQSCPT